MLVTGFPAEAFGTNCWVLAPAAGQECVVVDPGVGVADRLGAVLAEHRLRPVAVLLTHGHLDHTFSVAPVCGARGIPALVHPGDAAMLADPWLGLPPEWAAAFAGSGLSYTEPDDVRTLVPGDVLAVGGLAVAVDHTPGHTPGSVLFRLPDDRPDRDAGAQLCLSGDLLFAGSVGRTDLPGGDPAAMVRSLRDRVLPLRDDTAVLPGHGPATTVGRERSGNPWLRQAAA